MFNFAHEGSDVCRRSVLHNGKLRHTEESERGRPREILDLQILHPETRAKNAEAKVPNRWPTSPRYGIVHNGPVRVADGGKSPNFPDRAPRFHVVNREFP